MAVKIKLKRLGKIHRPQYRIVVADARTKRDGRAIEEVGRYDPLPNPSVVEVNSERIQYWLSVGAKPTESVQKLLVLTGDWEQFTGEGSGASLEVAAPKTSREEAYAAAVTAAAAVSSDDALAAAEAARKATSGEQGTDAEAGEASEPAADGDKVVEAQETAADAAAAEAEQITEAADEVLDEVAEAEAAQVEAAADEQPTES